MANTSSTIKIVFDGTARGVVAAAAEARTAIAGLNNEGSKLRKFGDEGGKALATVVKGMSALGAAGSAVQVIGGVVGAIEQLAPAALLLPGALAGGAAAFATLKVATAGFGDALKAGLSGDMEKFAETTKEMAPAMQDAAKAVVAFKPQIDDLKRTVQGNFWEDFSDQTTKLGNRYLPILKKGMGDVAGSLGTVAFEASAAMNNDFFSGAVAKIFDNTSKAIDNMSPAVANVLTGFARLAAVGSDFLPRLGSAVTDVTEKFKNWATGISDTQLKALIDGAIRGFQDLAGIAKNVGSILGSIFTGLGGQISSPLASLRELTAQLADFLKTAEAQQGLQALGEVLQTCATVMRDVLMTALREVAPLLVDLAPAAKAAAEGIGTALTVALQIVGPILQGVAKLLSEFPGVVGVAAFAVTGLVLAVKGLEIARTIGGFFTNAGSSIGLFGKSAATAGTQAEAAAVSSGKLKGALTGWGALGAAVALAAVAQAVDDINVKAAGGEQNLTGIKDTLHDLTGAAHELLSGDFGKIGDQFAAQMDQTIRNIQSGESVFGRFAGAVQRFFNGGVPPLRFDVNTGPAENQIAVFLGQINSLTPEVNINGNTNKAGFALREILREINEGKGEVIIDGRPIPAQEALKYVIGLINNGAGTVTINGNEVPAGDALADILGRTNKSVGTITIDGNKDPATGKVTQAVTFADGSKGTITVDGNPVPANGKTTGAVQFANGSKGTITIDGNQTPANGKINATVTYANGSRGTIQVDANTAAAQSGIDRFIRANDGRTIHIFTTVLGSGGAASAGRLATGGPVYGPGSGTSDTAGLFALSRGEHVLTAKEVAAAGGHAAILRMRRALLGGRIPRMSATRGRVASGGPISASGALTLPTPQVSVAVHIGGQPITDLVRTEIDHSNRQTRRVVGMGAGTTF